MGIRFECPNGHQLHVKAFLAGKRGICPDCDARFLIPLQSGGQATAMKEVAEEVTEEVVNETAAPSADSALPIAAPPLPGTEPTQQQQWYVRPATGDEQYGPADTETFRGWTTEGRVTPDSWVWRTGWPDWKKGIEALALLSAANEQPAAPPLQTEAAPPTQPTAPIEPAAPVETATQEKQPTRRSARRERAKKITVALSALVTVLLVVLLIVLFKE